MRNRHNPWGLMFALFLSFAYPLGAHCESSTHQFAFAVQKALTSLETGNWKSLAAMTSSSGLLIVKREFDLSASLALAHHPIKHNPKNTSDGDFDLDDLGPAICRDQEAGLTKSQVARLKFHPIGRQIQHIVQDTKIDYHASIASSLNAKAPEYATPLGPALVGKVCAGSWWYVYFRQEGGAAQWKVWKIEMYSR